MSALPFPSPQLPWHKTACRIHSCLQCSEQIARKVIFNWRKVKRTDSVKCLVLHTNVLQCNIQTPSFLQCVAWQRVQEAMAVECIRMGIIRYEACDFPRVNQAIRMQKRPCVCWKSSHVKVHVHEKLATEEKVNSKTYWGGRAVSIVQILKIIQVWLLLMPGITLCYPKITSQAFYSDELLQTHSVKWILCQ